MSELKKIIGLGAGGHARVIVDMLSLLDPGYEFVGFLDSDPKRQGSRWCGYPVLGGDSLLPVLRADGVAKFFLGLGSIKWLEPRVMLYDLAIASDMNPVSILHPDSTVSESAECGPGLCVMARAVVNAGACLGKNVCVNTAAVVEHDCQIGDHAFIGPGALLSGGVRVGVAAFVGIGAVIRQGVTIGSNAVVGAGAVVIRDVLAGAIVAGVPARPLVSHGAH